MRLNQLIQILVNRLPDTGFGQFAEGLDRGNDLEIHFFSLTAVNNLDRPGSVNAFCTIVGLATEKSGYSIKWFLGGRKADSNWFIPAQGHQSLQRQTQMNPAFVAADRMNFINNYILQFPEQFPTSFSAKQQVQ